MKRNNIRILLGRIHKKLTSRILPDEIYLKQQFYFRTGKKLNLENPQTFNEKLQWLKIHDRKDIYTTMVDKQVFKKYEKSNIRFWVNIIYKKIVFKYV